MDQNVAHWWSYDEVAVRVAADQAMKALVFDILTKLELKFTPPSKYESSSFRYTHKILAQNFGQKSSSVVKFFSS